ncbi:NUDIX hydrolase [Bowmanella denitrificans]|uniref:Phosphatase NudJ n=1 Tax=Bowmanella denitrificans TaxID=366582 RepID=A0ABN0WWN7_9ALTE
MFKPNVTVACVVEAQNRFLLVEEEILGESVFNQPAGHLEKDESIIDAAQRELFEETGLNLAPQFLVGTYLYPVARENLTFLRFCFGLRLTEAITASPVDTQIKACHWFTLEDIIQRQAQLRSPMVLRCIKDFRRGQQYDLGQFHYLP